MSTITVLYLRTVQRSVFVSRVSLPRTVSVNGDEVWIVGKPPLLLHSKDGFLACLAAFVTIQLFGMQGSCKDHARFRQSYLVKCFRAECVSVLSCHEVERAGKKFRCLESYLESQRPMADGLHQLCHWNFVRHHGRSFVIPSRRTKFSSCVIMFSA